MARHSGAARSRLHDESVRLRVGRRIAATLLVGSVTAFAALLGSSSAGPARLVRDLILFNLAHLAAACLCWWPRVETVRHRRAWRLLTIAVLLSVAGNIFFTLIPGATLTPALGAPAISDLFYLSSYPVMNIAAILLVRERGRHIVSAVWLDGLVIGLGAATSAPRILPIDELAYSPLTMTEQKVTADGLLTLLRGPAWLSRDARIVIFARALRTFGYGCTSILLAGMLSEDGVSAAGIGLLLGVAALGSVTASVGMGLLADRFGRRRSLFVTAGLMGVAGLVFAVCESYPVLLVAAFIGTISPSTNDNSPFSGVEQAILAQTCPAEHHTAVFARYSMSALLAGALGGLGAAALGLLTAVEPGDAAFLVYAALSAVIIALFRRLSPAVEPAEGEPNAQRAQPSVREGRRPSPLMYKLAGLFAVDAFAGGLAVQAILALWFQQRFGATDAQLGILFFGANLLPALSQAVAPALVVRYGLLGTMLVPHAVSNLLLLCVPWSPTFGWAATALWTRQALSKIDVPARQAFTAASRTRRNAFEDRRSGPTGVHGRMKGKDLRLRDQTLSW